MKHRINIIAAAILIMLGAIICLLVRGQRMAAVAIAAPAIPAPAPSLQIQVQALPPMAALQPAALPTVTQIQPAAAPQAAIIRIAKSNDGEYTAVNGDTLSNLAAALLGSDSKANRDVVIAANPSLQADPDRVLAGTTYFLSPPAEVSVAPALPEAQAISTPATRPDVSTVVHSDSDRVLTYTAQPGDNVSALAAGLLGGDSKINRDAIINKNKSLRDDPDKLVAGQTYKIPTKNGLSAATMPSEEMVISPATQPNDDDLVHMDAARELRYTARTGDNVSKLATVLLGSDTPQNRNAIINSNPSLKSDPDRVVAGQTYWIPAPTASAE